MCQEMRYLALAVDYDGTAAIEDRLSDSAAAAIKSLRVSGRRALLVTGRRVSELLRACPRLDLFDLTVAENGAVLDDPRQRTTSTATRRCEERAGMMWLV